MDRNYVIANVHRDQDFGPRVVYLTGVGSSYRFGYVTDAMRFSYEELLNFLRKHSGMAYLGFCVVRIEDCTFEAFKNNEELVRMFHRVDYALG